jgi:hypothetical protein
LSSIPFSFPALDFLVETHSAGFEDGMLFFFIDPVAAQASMSWNLPTDSAEEPEMVTGCGGR